MSALKYDPLGLGERTFQMMETGMRAHAEALGEGYKACGGAFGDAVGNKVGEAVAEKVRESVVTPQDVSNMMGDMMASNMDLMMRMASANPLLAMFMPKTSEPDSGLEPAGG